MTETTHHDKIKDFGLELKRQAAELSALSAKEGVKYSMIDGKCTLWQGSLDRNRPVWYHKGERFYVHKFVYEARKGLIPKGFMVKMTCGNRDCINSEHMELVTNLVQAKPPRTSIE